MRASIAAKLEFAYCERFVEPSRWFCMGEAHQTGFETHTLRLQMRKVSLLIEEITSLIASDGDVPVNQPSVWVLAVV